MTLTDYLTALALLSTAAGVWLGLALWMTTRRGQRR